MVCTISLSLFGSTTFAPFFVMSDHNPGGIASTISLALKPLGIVIRLLMWK
jgi:hypothetical protein